MSGTVGFGCRQAAIDIRYRVLDKTAEHTAVKRAVLPASGAPTRMRSVPFEREVLLLTKNATDTRFESGQNGELKTRRTCHAEQAREQRRPEEGLGCEHRVHGMRVASRDSGVTVRARDPRRDKCRRFF
jgi:hypothetical protein